MALPLAVVGLVGLLAPGIVQRRRWLRRIATAGGLFLCVEVAAVAGYALWGWRRPVVLAVRPPIPSRVRVVYGVEDGAPRRRLAWARRYEVPPSGIVYTQDAFDQGFFREDDPHPLRVVVRDAGGDRDTAIGAWVAGGATQSGTCTLAYEQFALDRAALGDTVPRDGIAHVGWLDSLGSWGVECRGGRLRRAPAGTTPRLERTGAACYYWPDGAGVGCFNLRVP